MTEPSNATGAASTILTWLRARSSWRGATATPVDALARALGLDVAAFDPMLHPGVWGFLEPGEDLIFLRAGLPEAARRFTLAHEIGHAMLHRGSGLAADIAREYVGPAQGSEELLTACQSADVGSLVLLDNETLGSGQSYSARARVEQEANAFAVELLMPEAPFLAAYLALATRRGGASAAGGTARLLARRFGVSEDAALLRLQRLLVPANAEAPAGAAPSGTPIEVDADQRAAARLETPALIMAGPGSGKTSTLVARMAYLVNERGVKREEILALTFSRKAAMELSGRIARALTASDAPETQSVSTIHHFCLDLLRRYGHLADLTPDVRVASEIESYLLVRQVMRELELSHLSSAVAPDLHVRDVQQAISRAKDDLISPQEASDEALRFLREGDGEDDVRREAAESQCEFAAIYELYQNRLRQQNAVDYGDIIALAVSLLQARSDVAEETRLRWPHLLVDEYQDINRAMGALLYELAPTGVGLWVVGDVDQAIYRFRGAEPGIVHRFSDTFPTARVVSLVRNYRSRRQILDVASSFAGQLPYPVERMPLQAARDEPGEMTSAVRIASAATDEDELDGLTRAIGERRQRGRPLHDQVVLLRTRRQVEQVAAGLNARGIPTRVQTGALDRDVVKGCVAVVSLLSERSGAGLIRAGLQSEHPFERQDAIAILRAARRNHRTALDALRRPGAIKGLSRAGGMALRRLGRVLATLRAAPSVSVGLGLYCFSLTGLGARLLLDGRRGGPDAASLKRLLDLAREYDNWSKYRHAPEASDAPPDWEGFQEYLNAVSTLRLDGLDDVLDARDDAVRVMTAHASKGLEFPVVYLPQLVNRRFPMTSRSSVVPRVQMDRGSGRGEVSPSDEASLFYVAMTRARDELTLSYARRYGRASYVVSPFLSVIEEAIGAQAPREVWSAAAASSVDDLAAEDAIPVHRDSSIESGEVFSLAELEAYQRCPRQYAYRYVDEIWSPATLVSVFSGVARHVARDLELAFAEAHEEGKPHPSLDEAFAMTDARWRAAIEDERAAGGDEKSSGYGAMEDYYGRQARATVERLWNRLARGDGVAQPAIARSRQVTVRVEELSIRGEVDVIEGVAERGAENRRSAGGPKGEGAAAVVRYRLGRSGASPGLRDLFAAVVADSIAKTGEQGRVIIRNLAGDGMAPLKLSARQRARLTREALAAAEGITRREFPTKPDEWQCQRCPFATACPE